MTEILSVCPLFHNIQPDDLTSLLHCLGAVQKSYAKGAIILQEGQPTQQVGVVLSGLAVMEYQDLQGMNTVLGSAGPGTVFGEAYACIPGEPLHLSVCAAEETQVLFLQIGRMLATCPNSCPFHTKLIRNLLTVTAQKSLALSRRSLHTSPKTIRGRLISYFSECVKRTGKNTFTVPYNRQQLADYLGVDRSALSNELSKMQRDGLIRFTRNDFTILEPHIMENA